MSCCQTLLPGMPTLVVQHSIPTRFVEKTRARVSEGGATAEVTSLLSAVAALSTALFRSIGECFNVIATACVKCSMIACRAESLGQVFLITVIWLCKRLRQDRAPEEGWSDLHIVYDNTCQLNRLLASKQDLPLPAHITNCFRR